MRSILAVFTLHTKLGAQQLLKPLIYYVNVLSLQNKVTL